MIRIRKAEQRGHAQHGWLESWHSFSFADYHDANEMGWGPLRVINEDIVQPGQGFGTHGHRDMEIVTYVLSGVLEHKDSMGNGEQIRRPEVQRMSAGSGVMHSEFNASAQDEVHLLQIWIQPDVQGIRPEYEQTAFSDDDKRSRLLLIASPDGREGSLKIHQDAAMYASLPVAGDKLSHVMKAGRKAYLHVVEGSAEVNGVALARGDAAKIDGEPQLAITAHEASELLLFDLP